MIDVERYKKIKGVIPSPKDDRDWLISQSINPVAYANVNTLKEYRTPVELKILDQKYTNACCAFSFAYCRYIQENLHSGNVLPFSRMFNYGLRQPTDHQGEGMVPRQAAANLKKYGIPHSMHFDGLYDYPTAKAKVEENLKELLMYAYPFRISGYYFCNLCGDIKYAVHTLGAASAMFPCYEELYYPDEKGYVKMPKNPNAKVEVYHQMTIVGWKPDGHWIVANSWGEEWGDKGYCYIPFDFPRVETLAFTDNISEVNLKKVSDFVDMSNKHWAYKALERAVQAGVFGGYEDNTLRPDVYLTRAEFASIMVRLGCTKKLKTTSTKLSTDFKDVPSGHWAKEELDELLRVGMLRGYNDNTLRPDSSITRAEMVSVLDRACLIVNTGDTGTLYLKATDFRDVSDNHWAIYVLNKAVKYSVLTGYADDTLRPDKNITRAETAVILDRIGVFG